MDNKTKDGYLISSGFVLAGIIFIYISGLERDITLFIGIGASALGLAGFKWPKVAEMLVHWAKKQESSNINKQIQRNVRDSNQIIVGPGGSVNINKPYISKKEKLPNIKYKISSVLPGAKEWNFIKDWKVWFLIKNFDDRKYKVYIDMSFIINNKDEVINVGKDYFSGYKPLNLNGFDKFMFPGLQIPSEVKKAALKKKKIEIRVNCEIKDENDKLIEKKLPQGYVYLYDENSWYLEP